MLINDDDNKYDNNGDNMNIIWLYNEYEYDNMNGLRHQLLMERVFAVKVDAWKFQKVAAKTALVVLEHYWSKNNI